MDRRGVAAVRRLGYRIPRGWHRPPPALLRTPDKTGPEGTWPNLVGRSKRERRTGLAFRNGFQKGTEPGMRKSSCFPEIVLERTVASLIRIRLLPEILTTPVEG